MSNEPMEYANQLPEPVAQITKEVDANTTLWVTRAGEFLYLPTEAQAKAKAEEMMKNLNPDEWWAQKISKFSVGADDYMCAYIKRDFSDNHDRSDFTNTSLDEMWIGRTVIGLPLRAMDTRERSGTQGKRVDQTMKTQLHDGRVINVPVLDKKGFYSYHKVDKKTVELYRKMEGLTQEGLSTQYVHILLNGGRNVGIDDPEEFWGNNLKESLAEDRNQKKGLDQQERGKTRPTNLK